VYNDGGSSHYAALTSVPVLDADDLGGAARGMGTRAPLLESVRLAPSAGSCAAHGLMSSAMWNPSEEVETVATVQPGALCLWPLEKGEGVTRRAVAASALGWPGATLHSIRLACACNLPGH
jgi:hypothetical protein